MFTYSMPEVVVPTARADVITASPQRYAKQLVEHLGHRLTVETVDGGQRLVFEGGSCDVLAGGTDLVLQATAVDAAALDRVTDVVGRHLERFGQRAELVVSWQAGS